jgi:hypothetical protein
MEMTVQPLEKGIQKVILVGKLDIDGAADIDLRFATLAGKETKILGDLSQVE